MIRAVTFDCWGTLIADHDMSRAMARRAAALVDASGGALSVDDARALMDRAWREHHDAWVSGSQFGSEGMARFCASVLGLDGEVVGSLCMAFEEASVDGECYPLDGALDSLRALREAGIRTALVCDTGFTPGRLVRSFLERFGLLPYLEFLAFSDEVGVPKPHPRMFERALDGLGVPSAAAAHVGDLRFTDVAGARAAGMLAIRFTAAADDSEPGPEGDHVIGSYEELARLLIHSAA
jgi:FMN phosphatase YigB (HAD superfamily)